MNSSRGICTCACCVLLRLSILAPVNQPLAHAVSFAFAQHPFASTSLAGLWLPGTVHVLNFGEELGGTDVDFLVGAVQQAQCSDLVGGGHVISGCFGFFAAECGLKGCDFGGLLGVIVSIGCHSAHCEAARGLYAHLLPVVQALVVVLEHRGALLLAGVVISRGVDDVAG